MTAIRLPNVTLAPNWTTLVGALEGAFCALGDTVHTHTLMGTTGHAFRITLTEEDGVLAAAPAAPALDLDRAVRLYRNTGRTIDVRTATTAQRDYPKRRARALRDIQRTIKRGRPAIAYDIHLPEYGIIHGFDDRARILYVSSLMSGQYGEALPESRWPVPERTGRMIVLLVGDRGRYDPARARHDALRFALDYAANGDPGDPTGATHGLAAFVRWRAAFERGLPIDPAGNARLIQTVQTARRDAARFLREVAAGEPHRGPALLDAATAYDRGALALSRMATLFPYPAGGDVTGAGGKIVAVGALAEAEAQERAALAAIRSIYSA
jgi:hypothetical protein